MSKINRRGLGFRAYSEEIALEKFVRGYVGSNVRLFQKWSYPPRKRHGKGGGLTTTYLDNEEREVKGH